MKELISVIVPVYNVEEYLSECIDSIMNQTYENLEIILIDDGSTDYSGKICDEYAEKDSRIKVIHKENGGVSNARNTGIRIAEGEYISFIDSDDFIDRNMYQILVSNIEKTKADISICKYVLSDKLVDEKSKKVLNVISDKQAFLELLDNRAYAGFLMNKLYRTNLLKNDKGIKQLNEEIYILEDLLFNSELIDEINKICYTDEFLYYYRQREDSALNKKFEPKQITSIIALLKLIEIYEKNNYSYTNQKKINFIFSAQLKKANMKLYNYENEEFVNHVNKKIKEFLKQKVLLKKGTLKSKIKCIIALIKPSIFIKNK